MSMALTRICSTPSATYDAPLSDTERVGWLSDRAAARWATFPAQARPRPVVLLESRVRLAGGVVDNRAKIAWSEGAIEWEVPPPDGLADQLPPHRERRGNRRARRPGRPLPRL